MSFLQPALLLAGLPLVSLPIIIHLINQRRYQTVQWAAMMFLLAANRMSRGYARIRQWLIMAFRMLAIATLVFAVARPLAGGWLGVTAGGRADTTIVVLDRSPSMQQESSGGGSKLETGTRQLVRALQTLGSTRWVLIDGTARAAREMTSADSLLSAHAAGPVSAPSDLPGLLEIARDYIKANKPGRTEIWICSDLRRNDWNAEDGRWRALRESFLEFPQGVRFHLLAYPRPAPANLSVRVTDVRRQKAGDGVELLVSLVLTREGGDSAGAGPSARETVPVQFEIGGARSEVNVEMAGSKFEMKDHRIPLERGRERGWGRVSIPADANPADNEFFFAFDQSTPRRAVVVADDPQAARALQLAAAIAPDPSLKCSAEIVTTEQLAAVEWDTVALLLWQAPLPEGDAAKPAKAFLDRGGRVVFFPPRAPGTAEFLGVRWTTWAEGPDGDAVANWRGDQDLLANTQSGAALPVGQLQVRKVCGLSGEFTPLATLRGGAPLLARVATTTGGAYFCATTPAPSDSSLATGGVVFYVLVQRAMAAGVELLEGTRQLPAGEPPGESPTHWKRLAGESEAVSTEYPLHRGVYASGDRLIAVNRPASEDGAPVLADDRVAGLFQGLDFVRVDDREGNASGLIQEVWRMFLVAMMVALVVEAGLCLPRPVPLRVAGAAS
jgi:hypothetical protein